MISPDQFEWARVDCDDDAPVLNAMFEYLADSRQRGAVVALTGTYRIRSPVVWFGVQATFCIAARFETTGTMDTAIIIESAPDCVFDGVIRVVGGLVGQQRSQVFLADRGLGTGVVLGNVARSVFGGFDVRGTRLHAVATNPEASQVSAVLGVVRAVDCGSPAGAVEPTHPSVAVLTWSNREDTGGATSVLQRTHLDVPGHELEAGDVVLVDGAPHSVDAVDGDRLSLYPHVEGSDTEGALVTAQGAALSIQGRDTAGLQVTSVYAQRVGVGLQAAGLYGVCSGSVLVEAACAAVTVGYLRNSALQGGHISALHAELVALAVLKVTSAPTTMVVGSYSAADTWTELRPIGLP